MLRLFTTILASIFVFFSTASSQNDDYYEVQEHGPGRWVTFFAPLSVQHKLTIPGVLGYELVFNPDFEIRAGRDPLFVFKFEETGNFNPALKPQLPTNTHAQFIIDGTPTAELTIRKTSFRNERDVRHVTKFYTVVNRQIIDNMINARNVRGLIYYRNVRGNDVQKTDVKSFTLDQKSIRTLSRLLSVTQ